MKTRQNQIILKKVLVVLPFYLFTFLPLSAQTFTQRIQTPVSGQGTVTIHEDPSIDQLVNSAQLGSVKPTAPATTNKTGKTTTTPATSTTGNGGTGSSVSANTNTGNNASANTEKTEDPAIDTSKKVMRGGYKVNGYRVQAFAGGNSRKDRQQAEQIGNAIKAQFGNVPVYVHFYSPRWICRVGNYRTYEEAHQMLSSIRKMGYTQATIVKGKITVQD